jgi:Sulfotransferase family
VIGQHERAVLATAGPIPDPVFVLCEARSGSTLLRFLLDAHPDMSCPAETNLPALCHTMVTTWSLMAGYPLPGSAPGQPPELPAEVTEGLRRSMDLMVSTYLGRVGKKRFCDKSLGSARYAGLLLQVYPQAKFVCLYRHPMDVIASAMEACPWGLSGYGFDPYIAATPGNGVFALARFWLESTAQIMSVEEDLEEHCLRLRYEDLVSSPDLVMSELLSFLGLPPVADIVSRCFRSEPEAFGASDHKIWHTTRITADSVGRGWNMPASLINSPVLHGINELSERLGYIPIDAETWGIGSPPPDVRRSARWFSRIAPQDAGTCGDGEAALVAGVLRDKIRSVLQFREPPSAPGSEPTAFRLHVIPDGSGPEVPAQLEVDVSAGTAEILEATGSADHGRSSAAWELFGPAATWRLVLAGEANLGVAFRQNEVRYHLSSAHRDGFDRRPDAEVDRPAERVQAERRIAMVSHLLGLAPWHSGYARSAGSADELLASQGSSS